MSILFDGRFSRGALFSDYAMLEINNQNVSPASAPYGVGAALTLVEDPMGSGDIVSRHYLDHSDPLVKRCEIDCPSDSIGTTRWYYNRIMLDPEWVIDLIGVSEIVTQVHDRPDAGDPEREPPFSVRVYQDRYQVIRTYETPGNGTRGVVDWEGALEVGRWIDWVYQIGWKHDGTGFLKVWKDGRPIVDQSNISTCFNDALPLYAKLGPYKYFHTSSPLNTRLTFNGGTVIGDSGYTSYNDFAKAVGIPAERERLAIPSGAICLNL